MPSPNPPGFALEGCLQRQKKKKEVEIMLPISLI